MALKMNTIFRYEITRRERPWFCHHLVEWNPESVFDRCLSFVQEKIYSKLSTVFLNCSVVAPDACSHAFECFLFLSLQSSYELISFLLTHVSTELRIRLFTQILLFTIKSTYTRIDVELTTVWNKYFFFFRSICFVGHNRLMFIAIIDLNQLELCLMKKCTI